MPKKNLKANDCTDVENTTLDIDKKIEILKSTDTHKYGEVTVTRTYKNENLLKDSLKSYLIREKS